LTGYLGSLELPNLGVANRDFTASHDHDHDTCAFLDLIPGPFIPRLGSLRTRSVSTPGALDTHFYYSSKGSSDYENYEKTLGSFPPHRPPRPDG
jgi:hypothetical protein